MSRNRNYNYDDDEENYDNPLAERFDDETDEDYQERMEDWYGDQ